MNNNQSQVEQIIAYIIRSFEQLIQRSDTDRDSDMFARQIISMSQRWLATYQKNKEEEPVQESPTQPVGQPTEQPVQLNDRQKAILDSGMKGNF